LYKSSAVADMGDRLAIIDVGRKEGRLLCHSLHILQQYLSVYLPDRSSLVTLSDSGDTIKHL